MKTRFNTFDIICVISELQRYVGMRVNNIYDIDNKTYLIKLQKTEEKAVILLESGNRIHSTSFEWPKNVAPSGFSMKMRKHLKNKRLESLTQLGTDRIVDLQFGTGEAAYHVILELYDKGNIILTDFELKILYILRPHTEGDKFKFAVREVYPQTRARDTISISKESLMDILKACKQGDQLKKVLVSNLEYGPAVVEHVLLGKGFSNSTKIGKTFNIENDMDTLFEAIAEAESIFKNASDSKCKGYIIQKVEENVSTGDNSSTKQFLSNQEFHPMIFRQHMSSPYKEFEYFNNAVDEFFSSLESQKIELKALQKEREALKKLDNIKKDHSQRLIALGKTQGVDKQKAELITRNQEIVEQAILAVQSALASQLPWSDIKNMIKDANSVGNNPVATIIKDLKLETNHITLYLTDPYASEDDEDDNADDNGEDEDNSNKIPSMLVDVDLALSAFANARKYYDQKRHAAKKQQKTLESQTVAYKSAEKKTKQTLKDVQTVTNIHKARKVYWFEKFFWFISSENYLVIAGRDQQQNELLVKRYLKPTDVYVHADIHGASSVIIKNASGQPVPPKTLNEAATMAICYSVAWEAKVVTNAYWVWGNQVSKVAPTGEYLTTGSFMIRGKKNFLPPSYLILGLSFLFKLEEGSIEKHKGERRVIMEEKSNILTAKYEQKDEVDEEIAISDGDEDEIISNSEKNEEISEEIEATKISKMKIESNSSENEEENIKYPDTQLKVHHSADTKINIKAEPVTPIEKETDAESVFFLGDDKPVILKRNSKSKEGSSGEPKVKFSKEVLENNKESNIKHQPTKRGQKSKLKKIKEKYKDQDEEERQLRMEILQSSGCLKENKKTKKNKDSDKSHAKKSPRIVDKPQVKKEVEYAGDDDEVVVQADLNMIDSLTGIPSVEDELLFAVPVVAPYNSLTNYKFKVKLTPGTGKKGKAAKTAIATFLKDRTVTQREKDLLRAVKDDQTVRNFPGKVKLSAPRLQTLKK